MYEYMNQLKKEWIALEELVASVPMTDNTECPLATLRIGDKIRLVYRNEQGEYKPIIDCKAGEMIAAVSEVPGFLKLWFAARRNIYDGSKIAVGQLAAHIHQFRRDFQGA